MPEIRGIDHLVLTVASIEATCDFYHRVLGMKIVHFADDRVALAFGRQKINLHPAGREFEPKAARPTVGSGDICLLSDQPSRDWVAHLAAHGVDIELGPVPRNGACGPIESIYLRDPDGNLVEVSQYR